MRTLLLAAILLCAMTGASRPLSAQETARGPAWDPRLTAPVASAGDLSRRDPSLTAVSGRRPWWAFPAIGAAAGGVLGGYVVYRECQDEACIGAGAFPVATALVGAAAGLLVEGAVRALR
jgi:hypothetical protein